MIIQNDEVKEIIVEIPDHHKHIRIRICLQDETELTFQEATIANMVRAYITVKTHPQKHGIRLRGKALSEKKKGFAEWQLVEE